MLFAINSYSQRYFPKLNNLFLENIGEESLFSNKTLYFKEGLKVVTNKLFYKNLQTSNGSNSAFYSLSIIPRFIFEYNFLDSGIFIKYSPKSKEEFPSFPIIFNEFTNIDEVSKSGNGNITIGDGGLSLLFDKNQIQSFDFLAKDVINNTKAEFIIEKIEYKINENGLEIELYGNFITDIKIKKSKIIKSNVAKLLINVQKEVFKVSLIDSLKNKIILITDKKIIL